jgi:hypothetical protein
MNYAIIENISDIRNDEVIAMVDTISEAVSVRNEALTESLAFYPQAYIVEISENRNNEEEIYEVNDEGERVRKI